MTLFDDEEFNLENGSEVYAMNDSTCTPIPAYDPTFVHIMQICVNIICVLSMLGAGLIIFTFVAFKTLRTNARQLLVQLSIADFMVAASHLVGVNVSLPRFAGHICSRHPENLTSDIFCKVQGGITIFFSFSSYFWTVAVAIYLLTVIVFENQRIGKCLTYSFYFICWGISAILVIIIGVRGNIGYQASFDTGTEK